MKEVLSSHKLRGTIQRIKVLEVLQDATAPLSAEEVHKALHKRFDLATVYRTLGSTVEAGILREASLGDGAVRYEWAGCHHHHIVCTECKDSVAVHVCLPERSFSTALKEASSFSKISGHAIQIFGLCKCCAAKA